MPTIDATRASCRVFTFKEGLLSPVAHDLEIRVERFELTIDDATTSVHATFDARSLRVVGAVRGGVVDPGALGEGDRAKIERSIVDDVLHATEHPEILFSSTSVRADDDGVHVEGDLMLHGRTRRVSLDAVPDGDELVARATLHQPDFGIRPFTAMLGALRIKPHVVVRLAIPK